MIYFEADSMAVPALLTANWQICCSIAVNCQIAFPDAIGAFLGAIGDWVKNVCETVKKL